MDPELKALLNALVEGQLKLAEGQARMDAVLERLSEHAARTDAALAQLSEHAVRTDAALARLSEHAARTDAALTRLTAEVSRLGARLDGFAEVVVRGFTDGAGRHGELRARIENLEARVTELEKHRHA